MSASSSAVRASTVCSMAVLQVHPPTERVRVCGSTRIEPGAWGRGACACAWTLDLVWLSVCLFVCLCTLRIANGQLCMCT